MDGQTLLCPPCLRVVYVLPCVSIAYLVVESRREQKFTVLDLWGFFESLVAAIFGMWFLGGVLLEISVS
jgi:hypothetical protein